MTLDFGVFDHLDRTGPSLTQFYEDRLTIAAAYDRLGFYGYHLAEHHSTPLGMAPSPSVFLSAIAQRTKRLRFGPLVYLLPFYHPLRLAEEISMLDQMSGGRFEFGLGRGISPIESRLYGNDPKQAQRQFDEAAQVIFAALRGGELTFEGEFYSYRDVPISIEPVQQPHPPLWYGLHTPESAERAARSGYNMVSLDGIEQARPTGARFREVWESSAPAGTAEPKIGLCRFIVIADTDAEALALARAAYPVWYESFHYLWKREGMRVSLGERPGDFDAAVADGRGVAGSPETVAAILGEQLAGSAYNYLIGQFAFGNLPVTAVLHSVRLFADHVMPALRA